MYIKDKKKSNHHDHRQMLQQKYFFKIIILHFKTNTFHRHVNTYTWPNTLRILKQSHKFEIHQPLNETQYIVRGINVIYLRQSTKKEKKRKRLGQKQNKWQLKHWLTTSWTPWQKDIEHVSSTRETVQTISFLGHTFTWVAFFLSCRRFLASCLFFSISSGVHFDDTNTDGFFRNASWLFRLPDDFSLFSK